MTSLPISKKNCSLPPDHQCLGPNSAPTVQNSDGELFSIHPLLSLEELSQMPKELILDNRISLEDTSESLSCFKGIALDPQFIRSQIFLIKDGSSIIGLITLFSIPSKFLKEKGLVKLEANKLVFKSYSDLFNLDNEDTFIIETGWFQILKNYRNTKLGVTIISDFLIPQIKLLAQKSTAHIIILSSATGMADQKTREVMLQIFQKKELPISEDMLDKLGKVHPESSFTPIAAASMLLARLENVINFSLGPVFIRFVTEEDKK